MFGPGTLVITVLTNGGRRSARPEFAYVRASNPDMVDGKNSAASAASRGPMVCVSFFASKLLLLTASSRSSGSAMSLLTGRLIAVTRLPASPHLSCDRTDIGAMATSESLGSSALASRYLRNAPPHTVTTTSFTVVPFCEFLIALTSFRSKDRPSNTLCGDTWVLNRVRGTRMGILSWRVATPAATFASDGADR